MPGGVTDENLDAAFSAMKLHRMFSVSALTGEGVADLVQATGRIARQGRRLPHMHACKIF